MSFANLLALLLALGPSFAPAMPSWMGAPSIGTLRAFDCLPEMRLTDFHTYLPRASLENAVDWGYLIDSIPSEQNRLIFEQSVAFELVFGKLTLLDRDSSSVIRLDGLTAPRATARQGEMGSRKPKQLEVNTIDESLKSLSHDYDLLVAPRQRAKGHLVNQGGFRNIFNSGTTAFSDDSFAVLLSRDRKSISLCRKIREYQSYERPEFSMALKATDFDTRALSGFLFRLFQHREVLNLLKCEQLL